MKEMKGYIVPVITIFNKDGSIDEAGMRTNVSYLVEEGVQGISVGGSFGEFPLLTFEERVRLCEIVVEEVKGRCAVIPGTAAVATAEVVRMNKAVEAFGVDGLMILPPYFLGPTERDIKEHYRIICDNTSLPIMIYNNSRTGVNLSPDLIMELSQLKNIVTVKQSSNDFYELEEVIRRSEGRSDFFITNGKEIWAFAGMLMGSLGTYGVSPLLIGRECVAMCECARKGDLERGRAIQYKVNSVRAAMQRCKSCQAPALRYLVGLRGLAGGYSRAPFTELTEQDKQILRNAAEAVKLGVAVAQTA